MNESGMNFWEKNPDATIEEQPTYKAGYKAGEIDAPYIPPTDLNPLENALWANGYSSGRIDRIYNQTLRSKGTLLDRQTVWIGECDGEEVRVLRDAVCKSVEETALDGAFWVSLTYITDREQDQLRLLVRTSCGERDWAYYGDPNKRCTYEQVLIDSGFPEGFAGAEFPSPAVVEHAIQVAETYAIQKFLFQMRQCQVRLFSEVENKPVFLSLTLPGEENRLDIFDDWETTDDYGFNCEDGFPYSAISVRMPVELNGFSEWVTLEGRIEGTRLTLNATKEGQSIQMAMVLEHAKEAVIKRAIYLFKGFSLPTASIRAGLGHCFTIGATLGEKQKPMGVNGDLLELAAKLRLRIQQSADQIEVRAGYSKDGAELVVVEHVCSEEQRLPALRRAITKAAALLQEQQELDANR